MHLTFIDFYGSYKIVSLKILVLYIYIKISSSSDRLIKELNSYLESGNIWIQGGGHVKDIDYQKLFITVEVRNKNTVTFPTVTLPIKIDARIFENVIQNGVVNMIDIPLSQIKVGDEVGFNIEVVEGQWMIFSLGKIVPSG